MRFSNLQQFPVTIFEYLIGLSSGPGLDNRHSLLEATLYRLQQTLMLDWYRFSVLEIKTGLVSGDRICPFAWCQLARNPLPGWIVLNNPRRGLGVLQSNNTSDTRSPV